MTNPRPATGLWSSKVRPLVVLSSYAVLLASYAFTLRIFEASESRVGYALLSGWWVTVLIFTIVRPRAGEALAFFLVYGVGHAIGLEAIVGGAPAGLFQPRDFAERWSFTAINMTGMVLVPLAVARLVELIRKKAG